MPRYNLRLAVSEAALRHNFALFKQQVGPKVRVAAVVKADGYGLGLETVIPIFDGAGADLFYVANLDEAVRARAVTTRPIFVFAGVTTPDDGAVCRHHRLTPVVNSPAQLQCLRDQGADVPIALHIDTGMNRLGFAGPEVQNLLDHPDLLAGLSVSQILSHFACSDERDHPMNAEQARCFDQTARALQKVLGSDCGLSLANSSGVWRDRAYHYDCVRPGYGLYGGNPLPERANPMQSVVTLTARVLQVRRAPAGNTVGYGATYRLDQDATLITIGGGYADGVARSLSNRGRVFWGDTACPIVGRVSMDLIVAAVPAGVTPPQMGDEVEVIGPHQTIDDLATAAGMIGYDILTGLGQARADRSLT